MNEPHPRAEERQLFEDLRGLIREELDAQLAMGRLGPVDPPARGTDDVAGLIADMVIRVYRFERRR